MLKGRRVVDECVKPQVAAGWEKGQIEKSVQDARRRLWQKIAAQPSLGALNDWLSARCIELWSESTHPTEPMVIQAALDHERAFLISLINMPNKINKLRVENFSPPVVRWRVSAMAY